MFFMYMLSSRPQEAIYIGATTNLHQRVWQHKVKSVPGFTAKYGVDRLVWFEPHDDWEAAARRERQLKKWKRCWKIELIERDNPQWLDLSIDLPP